MEIEKFYYYGWLSPKKELRRKELLQLKRIKELIVLLDTPYRLKTILSDIVRIFGEQQKIVVAFELTMIREKFFRGTAGNIKKIAEEKNLKGEFILLLDNRSK